MSTEDIQNYYKIDERVITGGQPTEGQIRSAAEDGYQAVVNLATIDPRYSLDDEGGLAQSLGMGYHHLPVEWGAPKPEDFDAFVAVMQQLRDQRVLLHCAANYRATAFYGLYAMQNLGWSEAQADALRAAVWQHEYPVWDEYVAKMKARIQAGQP
jgi:protein tyrosine phosphatase (PTP) superfamily phosphohydrolase (DUF442 family)